MRQYDHHPDCRATGQEAHGLSSLSGGLSCSAQALPGSASRAPPTKPEPEASAVYRTDCEHFGQLIRFKPRTTHALPTTSPPVVGKPPEPGLDSRYSLDAPLSGLSFGSNAFINGLILKQAERSCREKTLH